MSILYAFDFDKTLTKEHTFMNRCLEQTGQFVDKSSPQGFFGKVKTKRIIDDAAFSHSISNSEVESNLNNPDLVAQQMVSIDQQGDEILIVTKHDNIDWIQRNLRLILEREPYAKEQNLLKKIKIYALQNPKYLDFGGSKFLAIQNHVTICQQAGINITHALLIDDDIREGEKLKARLEAASAMDYPLTDISFFHLENSEFVLLKQLPPCRTYSIQAIAEMTSITFDYLKVCRDENVRTAFHKKGLLGKSDYRDTIQDMLMASEFGKDHVSPVDYVTRFAKLLLESNVTKLIEAKLLSAEPNDIGIGNKEGYEYTVRGIYEKHGYEFVVKLAEFLTTPSVFDNIQHYQIELEDVLKAYFNAGQESVNEFIQQHSSGSSINPVF